MFNKGVVPAASPRRPPPGRLLLPKRHLLNQQGLEGPDDKMLSANQFLSYSYNCHDTTRDKGHGSSPTWRLDTAQIGAEVTNGKANWSTATKILFMSPLS